MRRIPPRLVAARTLALCLCLLSAAAAAGEPDWRTWSREAAKVHPLGGRTFQPDGAPFMEWWRKTPGVPQLDAGRRLPADEQFPGGTLFDPEDGPSLREWSLLLLGEVHDNPDHHRLRAWLIGREARERIHSGLPKRPAVVFEHIRADQQAVLDKFKAEGGDLMGQLGWDKSGWPPAAIFKPLFDTVTAAKLPIYAGDPARATVKAVARSGLAALAAEERARLGLDKALPPALADALERELEDSHCGAVPPQAIGGMAVAQRYRDAHLAAALLDAAERHGSAVLIAGNGHVRADRGVPWHIRRKAPQARVLTVLHIEVKEGENDPAAYVPRDPDGKPAADLLIFTPRARRNDPCQALMKKRK